MPAVNPIVSSVIKTAKQWSAEFEALRALIHEFPFDEELKWGQPCYAIDGKNIVLIHGFKEYFALMFFKGALLKDEKKLLKTPGGHQATRQLRFTSLAELTKSKSIIKAYIKEAIEVEKSGAKVQLKKTEDWTVPEEFQSRLDADAKLLAAYSALTPGRQRNYLFHFSQPKKSETRAARVEKALPLILAGKGLMD